MKKSVITVVRVASIILGLICLFVAGAIFASAADTQNFSCTTLVFPHGDSAGPLSGEIVAKSNEWYDIVAYIANDDQVPLKGLNLRFEFPDKSAPATEVQLITHISFSDSDTTYDYPITFKSENGVPFHLMFAGGESLVSPDDSSVPLKRESTINPEGVTIDEELLPDGIQNNGGYCISLSVTPEYHYEFTFSTKIKYFSLKNLPNIFRQRHIPNNGDLMEVRLNYLNDSPYGETHENVAFRADLKNLQYVPGTAKFVPKKNKDRYDIAAINAEADTMLQNEAWSPINLGTFQPGEGGTLYFTAKAVWGSDDAHCVYPVAVVNIGNKIATDFTSAELWSKPMPPIWWFIALFIEAAMMIILVIRSVVNISRDVKAAKKRQQCS